jgi:hypothetical protein
MLDQFKRGRSSGHSVKIKNLVRELLACSDEHTILVTELKCTEPGCPPLETMVAVLGPGGAKYQQKVHLALEQVAETDVQSLVHKLKAEMTGQMTGQMNKQSKEDCHEHR